MLQARNIKQLHKPLIWNSSFSSCKPLVLIKNRCQAPPLQFSQASHKTTGSMLYKERKHTTINMLECSETKIRYRENANQKSAHTFPRLQWIKTGWFLTSALHTGKEVNISSYLSNNTRIEPETKHMMYVCLQYQGQRLVLYELYLPGYSQMAPECTNLDINLLDCISFQISELAILTQSGAT